MFEEELSINNKNVLAVAIKWALIMLGFYALITLLFI